MSKAFITAHVLNQYVNDEKSAEFYFRLLAWMAINEPTYWEWSDREIMGNLRKLSREGQFADPVVIARTYQILRRWSARAFILGMRRLSSEAGMPMEFDFILPRGEQSKERDVPWGERRELSLEDFNE